MLWTGALRGFDSTGLIYGTKGDTRVYKRGLPAPDFINTIGYDKAVQPNLDVAKYIIGHNRAATRGSVCDAHAHPFQDGKITLVHNGFISNANMLLPNGKWATVDSMAVPYVLNEKGEKDGLEALNGAFALAWYNSEDHTVNLARNKERDLYYVQIKDKNVVMFASEFLMLHWIISRRGLEPEGKYQLVPAEMHIKIPVETPKVIASLPFSQPRIARRYYPGLVDNGNKASTTIGGKEPTPNTAGTTGTKPSTPKEHEERVDAFLGQITTLSKSELKLAGVPTARRKLRAASERLTKWGYTLGQSICISAEHFQPYRNQRERGVVLGMRRSDHSVSIELPNMTRKKFDQMREATLVFGLVAGLEVKMGHVTLICVHDERQQVPGGTDDTVDETLLPTYDGHKVTKKEWLELVKAGCAWCSEKLEPAMANDMVFTANGDCLCPGCAVQPEVLMYLGLSHPSERKALNS